ncbi:hypothetical protein [Microbacterium sp.]|jgi:hypothetical protein|uniref:hypothetical protein n=1 Tax=Microbacterium sp. TaxID=51671 RepID=UPI0035AFA096
MSGSQVVEIVVRGTLGPDLVAALPGFTVEVTPDACTRVVGTIPDQARLLGLLDMLDELHIEVVSVNPVPARDAP